MEFALAANDAMGNVVAIAEDDCRPGFHCELLWREGEIIDVHLHTPTASVIWSQMATRLLVGEHQLADTPFGLAEFTLYDSKLRCGEPELHPQGRVRAIGVSNQEDGAEAAVRAAIILPWSNGQTE